MTKPIDLTELRRQIKEGIFNVYLYRKRVYIEDAENGESVMIYSDSKYTFTCQLEQSH